MLQRTGDTLLVKGANGRNSCGWSLYQATLSDGWRCWVRLMEVCGLRQSEQATEQMIVAQQLYTVAVYHPSNSKPLNKVASSSIDERSWEPLERGSGAHAVIKSSDCDGCVCLCVKLNVCIWTVKGCGSQWISCCLRFTIRDEIQREGGKKLLRPLFRFFPLTEAQSLLPPPHNIDWKLNHDVQSAEEFPLFQWFDPLTSHEVATPIKCIQYNLKVHLFFCLLALAPDTWAFLPCLLVPHCTAQCFIVGAQRLCFQTGCPPTSRDPCGTRQRRAHTDTLTHSCDQTWHT